MGIFRVFCLGSWFYPALCYSFLHASSVVFVFSYEKTEREAFCIELGNRNGGKVWKFVGLSFDGFTRKRMFLVCKGVCPFV